MSVRPAITVAAVVETHGRFLLVEERVGGRLVFNQPAGHVEPGEDILDAVVRETLEETTGHFRPQALLGSYLWQHPGTGALSLRFAFIGEVTRFDTGRALDPDIERTVWLTRAELLERVDCLRSPLVLGCIDDYLAGQRAPLSAVRCVDLHRG